MILVFILEVMSVIQFMDFVKKLASGEVSMEDKDEVGVVVSCSVWPCHVLELFCPGRWLPLVMVETGPMSLKKGRSPRQEMVVSGVNWRRNGMTFPSEHNHSVP